MTTKSYTTLESIPSDVIKGWQGSSCSTSQTVNRPPVALNHTRTGVPNPYWKQQVRDGRNAATPFSSSHQFMTYSPVVARVDHTSHCSCGVGPAIPMFQYNEGTVDLLTFLVPGAHFSSGTVGCASSRAISSLYKKINNAHHQFQGGVFVGEIQKTLKMIVGGATRLKKGALGFLTYWRGKKPTGNRKKDRALSKQIADHWLETVFGWQPLIMDIQDAAVALARLKHQVPLVRFRALGSCEEQTSLAKVSLGQVSCCKWFLTTLRQTEAQVIYYGGFRAELGAPDTQDPLDRLIKLGGFDLRSLIPTLWELTPWSFLVDYFVNVGEVLEAMTADTSVVSWIVKVTKQTSIENQILEVDPSSHLLYTSAFCKDTGISTSGTPGRFEGKLQTVTRSPLSEVPLLMPRLKFSNLSGKQFVNMGALFVSKR